MTLLQVLYLANALWFLLAFFQFSFRQRQAMASGSLRRNSTDSKVKSTPEGDAWHHDLLAYLGGINLAPAALAAIRLAVLLSPESRWLSTVTTGSPLQDRPLDVLSLVILGLANFSQARINFFVVRNTGRWILGDVFEAITAVDALLTLLDWTFTIAVARGVYENKD